MLTRDSRRLVSGLCLGLALAVTPFASVSAATGGPDMFGYTYIDSAAPAGPVFMGVDITMTGTMFAGGDDITTAPIPLNSPFDYYGSPISSIVLNTNGFITDDTGSGNDRSNDCPLPAPPSSGAGFRMYALHDDLVVTDMFVEYFGTCPRPADRGTGPIGCTIVQWNDVTHFGGMGSWDQWAYLYDNFDIVFEIGSGNPETGSGSTTGIQDGSASDGLTAVCNTPGSVPNDYTVLFEYPCDQAPAGDLAPPVGPLVVAGAVTIDADLGTVAGVPDPGYRGAGLFVFTTIDILPGATLTFAGSSAPQLFATGAINIDGTVDLDGAVGTNSGNGQPGGPATPGLAGGGSGGAGGCRTDWQHKHGQRGGGTYGGFGGTTPGPGGGYDDVTGGGGGGNATMGFHSDPPRSGSAPAGRGACAIFDPFTFPLQGGGGGAGGGCDVDDPQPTPPGGNDGGGSGGAGGGAIRFETTGDISISGAAMFLARGGNGGTSSGNGGSAGGGAGGTLIFIAGGNITNDGTFDANGGLGGLIGQANATSGGGPGGAGFVGLYDADGVIAGAPSFVAPAPSPPPMMPRVPVVPVTGMVPVFDFTDLAISNGSLPDASPSSPYTATITAAGGSGSYSFSVSAGLLPAGLSLDPMTGAISGTSTETPLTVSDFTIAVTDGAGMAERNFCIQTSELDFAITTDSVPNSDVSAAYSATITTVGGLGTPVFALVTGALPTGLTLNTTTGVISGTTGANPEMATFVIKAEDSPFPGGHNRSASVTYTIVVGLPTLAGAALPLSPAEECQPYSQLLASSLGTPPHTFELLSGMLPAGVLYDPMAGLISGTPMPGTAGAYDLCFYVYDVSGLVGVSSVPLTVNPPMALPACSVTIDSLVAPTCVLPALAIPDNDPMGVTNILNIPGSGIIQDMTVDLAVTHTWVGDLYVELTHVGSGTTIVLLDRPGVPASVSGCLEIDINCTFSDSAAIPVEGVCSTLPPAIGGLVIPEQALSAFRGLDMNGDWQLFVSDEAAGDTGTLDMWCVNIDSVPIPQSGSISVEIEPTAACDPTVDVLLVEYSLDGGATFIGSCTPSPTSVIVPPQMGVPTGVVSVFLWDSTADGIAPMSVETQVLVRVTVSGSTGMSFCESVVFEIDNQCLCGDCDMSGALPVSVLDALIAAQISAGLVMPTSLQMRCCDVNSVGGVTIVDALLMAQAAAGLPVTIMCP